MMWMTSSSNEMWLKRLLRAAVAACALALVLGAAPSEAHASGNLIKRPGAHNRYKFEIEPQFAGYYGGGTNRMEGGPGVRVNIPFMHNGPIDTINNNIGISFGGNFFIAYDQFWVHTPAAFQWNFYFTDVISVIGEAGLAFSFGGDNRYGNNFWVDPVFQGGGRFQWGKVGVVVRVGYPSISVGCNLQF